MGRPFSYEYFPVSFLLADLAIRRPQLFKPLTGTAIYREVRSVASGAVLQSGATVVQANHLVVIPQVAVFRENLGEVRIFITDMFAGTQNIADNPSIRIFPNPARDFVQLPANAKTLRLLDLQGRVLFQENEIQEARLPLNGYANGLYLMEIGLENGVSQTLPLTIQH